MKTTFQFRRHDKCTAYLLWAIIGLMLICPPAFAVSEAAVLFLLISPSPQANAMGQTYGNILAEDPMALTMNPAGLGLFAQKHNIATSFYPWKTKWLPAFGGDLAYKCSSHAIGINLQEVIGLPLSFGLAYNYIHLDLGTQYYTDESGPEILGAFDSYETAKSIVMAASLDYYVRFSVGLSSKSIESNLSGGAPGMEEGEGIAKVKAHDVGYALQVPFIHIAEKLRRTSFKILPSVKPFFDIGFTYSRNNIGDEVIYIKANQPDPLPRTIYLGSNLNLGICRSSPKINYDILCFKYAREANDMLVQRNPDGTWKYLSGLNEINFMDNVIWGKGNSKIITQKGWELGIMDCLFIRGGKYEDMERRVNFRSSGWGVNLMQILRLVAWSSDTRFEGLLDKIVSNLDMEFHRSEYDPGRGYRPDETTFNGILIKLSTFHL